MAAPVAQQPEQKFLLMGPSMGGKTCMRSVIFENYLPRDVLRLLLSVGIADNRIRILNNLHLNLWDCGGQKDYVTKYLTNQKEYIFRSVTVMLFVFDVLHLTVEQPQQGASSSSGQQHQQSAVIAEANPILNRSTQQANNNQKMCDWTKEEMLTYFATALTFLREYSPDARLYVLLHKIDTISEEYRAQIVETRKAEILKRLAEGGLPESVTKNIVFYATSLWSNSLYYAYSNIIRHLVPNRNILVNELRKIQSACGAADVALYEKHTLLTIAHINEAGEVDAPSSEERTAKLAEIVKSFKLSCLQSGTSFRDLGLRMGDSGGTALLSPFTECTVVLVVCHTSNVTVELHKLNIETVRRNFLQYLQGKDPIAQAMLDVL